MTIIQSNRHKIKFYFLIVFMFLFLCGLGTLLALLFIDLYRKDELQAKIYFLPFVSLGIYFMAFYTVYKYFDNAPKVTIDKYSITLNGIRGVESFDVKDISHLRLTGKMPFNYLVSFPMEGIKIKFKNGKTKYLYDDMYSNLWKIKSYLHNLVVEKKQPREILEMDSRLEKINLTNLDTFQGNQWTSFRGIGLWGMFGFFFFIIELTGKTPPGPAIIILLVIGLFWFLFSSYLMHYFGVTKDYLIIKNHNLFWINKMYRLSDVKEAVFETQGKMPNCLRVITKNFHTKLYPAGTLRDKHWLAFKDRLEKNGIKVRNECI